MMHAGRETVCVPKYCFRPVHGLTPSCVHIKANILHGQFFAVLLFLKHVVTSSVANRCLLFHRKGLLLLLLHHHHLDPLCVGGRNLVGKQARTANTTQISMMDTVSCFGHWRNGTHGPSDERCMYVVKKLSKVVVVVVAVVTACYFQSPCQCASTGQCSTTTDPNESWYTH